MDVLAARRGERASSALVALLCFIAEERETLSRSEPVAALVSYVEGDATYPLQKMREMLWVDFQVDLSTTTISKKLRDKLYTVNQLYTLLVASTFSGLRARSHCARVCVRVRSCASCTCNLQ